MMGLGPMGIGVGGGNSSSSISTSNLSASAPPFSVDRLNPNSNSNPNRHYQESPYLVEQYSHTWQYAHPSAPGPDLVISSTGISSAPLYDDYQFSASASVSKPSTHWSDTSPSLKASGSAYGYGGEVDPYYSPYVPPMVGEGSSVVEDNGPRYSVLATSGLSVSSQIDYTPSLFDLEYGRQWVDCLGFDDGKRAKRVELDGSLFSEKANAGDSISFKNQLNQGACGGEYWNKSKDDFGAPYQKFNQVSDLEVNAGSLRMRPIEDQSCLEENLGFLSYESSKNKTHIPASNSTYPESNPLLKSFEMQDNFSNYRNAFDPYKKCVRTDSPFTGPISVIRSSPAVVIRPPPASNGNIGQSFVSRTPTRKEDSSKLKGSGLKLSSEISEDSYEENLYNFSKQGSDQIFMSSNSVKEPSTALHTKDAYDCNIKARFGSQLPDINVSGDFSMACDGVQFVNSTEGSSDFIDHNNTAVDSPCWKGAPSSQFSSFDVEAYNSNHTKKKLNEYYEEHQKLQSISDSSRLISEKSGEVRKCDEKECAKNGVGFVLERTLGDIYPSREIMDCPNSPSNKSGILESGFDVQISGPTHFIGAVGPDMALNDVPEGGDVAVHMAERILDSLSSQEDATEPTKLLDPKLNVPTMIKAIHSLSELLFFHLSNDAYSLEEENTETLKHIISNLDLCMTKKVVQVTNMSEPSNSMGDSSDKVGESCNVGATMGNPHPTHETTNTVQPDNMLHMEGKPGVSSLRDDLDITRNDVMDEAIRKVLEENFHFDEGMHSQALLFKNLWLEAEAKLCSISYKARFDRMKIQMEKFKLKAPRENEDVAEMMSKVCISPDPNTASELSHKGRDGPIPKPSIPNVSSSSTSGPGSDSEASDMARFNILRSREENLKPISDEKEKHTEWVDGEHASPVMTRFNILKSREEMSMLMNTEEEKQPGMVDGEHGGPVMARFNILKSREDKSKSINMEEGKQPEMVGDESVMVRFNILKSRDDNSKSVHIEDGRHPEMVDGEFYMGSCIGDQSEDEILNVALKPHFMHESGGLGEGKFGSYVDGSGYESLKEVCPSITNDQTLHSFNSSSRIINQDYAGWRDSSSSDWEHVLKDDFSWKNL
ncbi:hypothetical protein BUALT_Bualt06G0139400 [Buddleja alternifolia]|uniref:Uncharacterized protein n=1 Tax=Buddleja alternifolia TaxID=168488 RepID=A0AAV6XQX6_9LAMI|nr:hypothetical protein BUALT_Bualt06G0139400 [Buddleja alternifolia]